jgi:HAD superfamily hydrolase (TIGR01490 family)
MTTVAFFDLDLTLLDVNTATLWVKRELREKSISKTFFLKSVAWVGLYQLGVARMEEVIEKAIAQAAGLDEEATAARTRRFYDEEVQGRFRPGALDAVKRHQAAGDRCVLLTSSSPYLSAPVAERLGLDGVLCNRFEVEGGRFTGRPHKPLCYGPGKLHYASAWLDEHGGKLSEASFYTDSFSDLPVLEAVGRPVAVHPDPRLRRTAERRRWEVADWGKAGGRA